MRELSFDAEFDAVYNYFTSWGYYDDETNFDILKRVHHALKPGGRFLLEFIARDALMRRFKDRDWTSTLTAYLQKGLGDKDGGNQSENPCAGRVAVPLSRSRFHTDPYGSGSRRRQSDVEHTSDCRDREQAVSEDSGRLQGKKLVDK